MTEKDRQQIRMTAAMDGERVIVESIGPKRKLSGMELVVLCTFAKLGMNHYLASQLSDDAMVAHIEEMNREIEAEVQRIIGRPGVNGMGRLATTCAAMVCDGRLSQYVLEP